MEDHEGRSTSTSMSMSTKKNNRRKRIGDWREGPAFLDATSSVSASTFGARRLPELKNLYFQSRRLADTVTASSTASTTAAAAADRTDIDVDVDTDVDVDVDIDGDLVIHERKNLLSGGGKRSSRHLRRRTIAFRSKKHRHRYPFQTTTGGVCATQLQAQAYKGATRKSRRKKRSFLEGERLKWLMRRPLLEVKDASVSTPTIPRSDTKTVNVNGNGNDNGNGDPIVRSLSSTSSSSPHKLSWLVTHLWHSKRFHLLSSSSAAAASLNNGSATNPDPVFGGWTGIPLVHTNRGPRAALRLSQNKDTINSNSNNGSCVSSSSSSSSVMVRDVTWEGQPLLVACTSVSKQQQQQQQRTTQVQFLLQHMGTICPGLLALLQQGDERTTTNTNHLFFSGGLSLEETVYEPNSFPSGAIGPSVWRFLPPTTNDGQATTPSTSTSTSTTTAPPTIAPVLEIRCHPSIRPRIQNILRQLANTILLTPDSPYRLETVTTTTATSSNTIIEMAADVVPRICFRLYGVASLDVLDAILKLPPNSKNVSTVIEEHRLSCRYFPSAGMLLPDGSIVSMPSVAIAGAAAAASALDDITLIYRSPRPLDCPANSAIAGWEVHCSNAAFAKALWLALVTLDDSASSLQREIRGCCAIGLIEDCHMRLECEPPIPLFPRDCVDTEDSQRYWMASSSSPSSYCSWKRIRQLCEGGWGRLPIHRERRLDKLVNVDFSKLVLLGPDDDDEVDSSNSSSKGRTEEEEGTTNSSSIVAVRGAFGQPFVDAIKGLCGNYIPNNNEAGLLSATSTTEAFSSSTGVLGNGETNNSCDEAAMDDDRTNNNPTKKKRRRNRRQTRPKNQVILSPPLSKASRASLGDYCHKLSSSLSLPAVLLVHIRAVGNGRIQPGMAIVCADTDNDADGSVAGGLLGRITAGGFSTSRGVCHGIGVIGAVRLLGYLGRITAAAAAPPPNPCDSGGDRDSCGSSTTNDGEKSQHPTESFAFGATPTTTSYGRIVRLANGSQSLQMLVRVVNNNNDNNKKAKQRHGGSEASLSVLI